MVPRGDRSVYIGATNRVSAIQAVTARVTAGEIHSLLHSAIHEINTGLQWCDLGDVRYGLRPLCADGRPLIGMTELDGLAVATGTYRNGVLMAPEAAAVIADEVTGRSHPDANRFSPRHRQSDLTGNDATARALVAIDAGLSQLSGMLREPSGMLPYNREREVTTFVRSLARIALHEDEDSRKRRELILQVVTAHPLAEVIPELVLILHEVLE
jgi:glycine oxidase